MVCFKQRNIHQNPPSLQGGSEKEMFGEIGTEQLIPSA
jgi:hypothetical protein